MRRTLQLAVAMPLVAAAAVGLLAADPGARDLPAVGIDGRAVCSTAPLAFTEPLQLGQRQGYEPSIEVDSAGTIFVTAHKASLATEGQRAASWLWRSADDGATFSDMTGLLLGVTDKFWALEGDLALDGNDALYFVDTWAADNHVYRFVDHGETLEHVKPVVASAEIDDRPWLAAHGDGVVYYLSNTAYTREGRLTIHRSTDGGETFDIDGFRFPDSGWGFIDADPNGPHVYGVFDDLFYGTGLLGDALGVYAWHSPDQGLTWTQSKIADLVNEYNGEGYPTVAVSPVDGTVWALWLDGTRQMRLARSTDHGASWKTFDVTPFPGEYGYAWLEVGAGGDLAVVFSATNWLLDGDPDEAATILQRPYAMLLQYQPDCLTDPAVPTSGCTQTFGARYVALQEETAGDQGDFFQVAVGPDAVMHVAYTDRDNGTRIKYVRQESGANLAGRQICGFSGSMLPGDQVRAWARP